MITLRDAEERLKGIDPFILRVRNHFDGEKIFRAWASDWDADKWEKRLNHLRERAK
jgi:hypothetical protein